MFKKILTTTALASLMAFSASSFAAATPVNNNGTFVGVNGIVIGSDVYNVSWSLSRDSLPLKWYDKTFAQKASSALFRTLNSHIANRLWAFDKDGNHRFANQNAHFAGLNMYWMDSSYPPSVTDHLNPTSSNITAFSHTEFAHPHISIYDIYIAPPRIRAAQYELTWTKVSAVPTPSAALMFAPALLGFAALRCKKRA